VILGILSFPRDLGGPGPLKNINIPIGISTFSAWDRPDHPKPLKTLFLPKFLKNTKTLAYFPESYDFRDFQWIPAFWRPMEQNHQFCLRKTKVS